MTPCLLCGAKHITQLLDFGLQPICNRFLATPDSEEETFPMRIGQCEACGQVQNTTPVSPAELKPRCDWVTYTEAEGHLDVLADTMAALPSLTKDSVICGISFKDDSLLQRMSERGYVNTRRLNLQNDLNIIEAGTGVETLQDRLTPAAANRIAQAQGKADVIIARHIWEHTTDPINFLAALKELMTPQGYLVLEVPDCERALAICDYSTVWEEHTLYFTPATFRSGILLNGFSLTYCECFPYTLENSLVAIARIDLNMKHHRASEAVLEQEKKRAQVFSTSLSTQSEKIGNYFRRFRQEHGNIAILGAGHLACTYVNLLHLKEHIDCLVDDNPHKRGLYMPGSRLPIYESGALLEKRIKLCLLSVNAEIEDRVIRKNKAFINSGGVFHSIFAASKHALPV